MKAAFLVALVTTLAASPAVAQFGDSQIANVMFHVVYESGRVIPFRVDSFGQRDRKLELSSHFSNLQATDIPYGTYDYVLGGATPITMNVAIPGRVEVRWPENLVVVQTDAYPHFRGDRSDVGLIDGRIEHLPPAESSPGPVWLRLNPVYTNYGSFDVPVKPTGEFRIHRVLIGQYMLTVIRGHEILAVQPLLFEDASKHEPLVISLSDAPLAFLTVRKRR